MRFLAAVSYLVGQSCNERLSLNECKGPVSEELLATLILTDFGLSVVVDAEGEAIEYVALDSRSL